MLIAVRVFPEVVILEVVFKLRGPISDLCVIVLKRIHIMAPDLSSAVVGALSVLRVQENESRIVDATVGSSVNRPSCVSVSMSQVSSVGPVRVPAASLRIWEVVALRTFAVFVKVFAVRVLA